jgi:hypothetical protein
LKQNSFQKQLSRLKQNQATLSYNKLPFSNRAYQKEEQKIPHSKKNG